MDCEFNSKTARMQSLNQIRIWC